MTPDFIQNITAIGLIALFLVVMRPLILSIAERLKITQNNNDYKKLSKQVSQLRENEFFHLEKRLDRLERNQEDFRSKIEEMDLRLSKVEWMLNNKK